MWTKFFDMYSGGGQKLDWGTIYIEAPRNIAEVVFYNRFGRSPHRVTCTCCGEDFSVSEFDDISEVSERQGVRFIREDEILDDEKVGQVPDEGYVWVD